MPKTSYVKTKVSSPTQPSQQSRRDRRATKRVANVAVAGVVAVGAAVACAATAAADPAPPIPADPATPGTPAGPTGYEPPPSTITSGLTQNNDQPTGPAGLPLCMFGTADDSGGSPPCAADFLLGQTTTPALRGQAPASPFGDGSALNTGYLFPENATMTAQEQTPTMYGLGAPGDDSPPTDQWDAIRRARGLFHGMMGRMPEDQLGGALPGTAPPPGTDLPVGTN